MFHGIFGKAHKRECPDNDTRRKHYIAAVSVNRAQLDCHGNRSQYNVVFCTHKKAAMSSLGPPALRFDDTLGAINIGEASCNLISSATSLTERTLGQALLSMSARPERITLAYAHTPTNRIFGLASSQVYQYYQRYPDDHPFIRWMVSPSVSVWCNR